MVYRQEPMSSQQEAMRQRDRRFAREPFGGVFDAEEVEPNVQDTNNKKSHGISVGKMSRRLNEKVKKSVRKLTSKSRSDDTDTNTSSPSPKSSYLKRAAKSIKNIGKTGTRAIATGGMFKPASENGYMMMADDGSHYATDGRNDDEFEVVGGIFKPASENESMMMADDGSHYSTDGRNDDEFEVIGDQPPDDGLTTGAEAFIKFAETHIERVTLQFSLNGKIGKEEDEAASVKFTETRADRMILQSAENGKKEKKEKKEKKKDEEDFVKFAETPVERMILRSAVNGKVKKKDKKDKAKADEELEDWSVLG